MDERKKEKRRKVGSFSSMRKNHDFIQLKKRREKKK